MASPILASGARGMRKKRGSGGGSIRGCQADTSHNRRGAEKGTDRQGRCSQQSMTRCGGRAWIVSREGSRGDLLEKFYGTCCYRAQIIVALKGAASFFKDKGSI